MFTIPFPIRLSIQLHAPSVHAPVAPAEPLTLPDVGTDVDTDVGTIDETREEPPWLVLVLNDDETPYIYVMAILMKIFDLSQEIAEHVTWTAHDEGRAVVRICSRAEAERRVAIAHSQAARDGFPLTFDVQQES